MWFNYHKLNVFVHLLTRRKRSHLWTPENHFPFSCAWWISTEQTLSKYFNKIFAVVHKLNDALIYSLSLTLFLTSQTCRYSVSSLLLEYHNSHRWDCFYFRSFISRESILLHIFLQFSLDACLGADVLAVLYVQVAGSATPFCHQDLSIVAQLVFWWTFKTIY